MTIYLGDFPTGKTIYIPFHTFNSSGASVTITGLAVTDIEVYRNGSVTQRASDAGYALLDTDGIDFDALTGIHGFSIDTSDNTDAGFYAAGYDYWVVVSAITVDAQTVSFVAAIFSIDNRQLLRPTVASRTLDVSAGGEAGVDWANVGSPTTTLNLSGTSTKALEPTTAGRTLDVTTTGEAGLDFANVNLPAGAIIALGIVEGGTAQSATGTTLVGRAAATNDSIQPGMTLLAYGSTQGYWQSVLIDSVSGDTFTIAAWPLATPSGTITYQIMGTPTSSTNLPPAVNAVQLGGDAQSLTDLKDFADAGYDPSTNKVQGVVLTDTATNLTNAPGAGDFTATMKTSIGTAVAASAVASVTGNVGGNVTGSVGSVATGGITAASIATGAFDADALATDAVTEIVTGVLTSAMTEAYPTDGSTMTVAQALYLIAQSIGEFSVSGTTVTVKKVDGTTTAATYTLDSSTAPTSRTRAT